MQALVFLVRVEKLEAGPLPGVILAWNDSSFCFFRLAYRFGSSTRNLGAPGAFHVELRDDRRPLAVALLAAARRLFGLFRRAKKFRRRERLVCEIGARTILVEIERVRDAGRVVSDLPIFSETEVSVFGLLVNGGFGHTYLVMVRLVKGVVKF